MEWREVILGFLAGLLPAGISYGDMTGIGQLDGSSPPEWMTPRGPSESESMALRNLADLDWFAVRSRPPLTLGGSGSRVSGPSRVLADRQGSLHLCLYALLGLGLFRSVPCVRRLPLGAIPAWYHEAGPAEISHCLAISSDCLRPESVCFIQPEAGMEDLQPLYRLRAVVLLRRRSQFVFAILAPRGPPFHSR